MFKNTKAQMAALLSGFLIALVSGTASSVTFSYPADKPGWCKEITIATSGVISCTGYIQNNPSTHVFTIMAASGQPLGPCSALNIAANGEVGCTTDVPQSCKLTASPTTVAPGGSITLTASGCTPTPTSYVWTGSGVVQTTADSTTATLPTIAGPYPYSVTAMSGSNAGVTAEATVNVAIPSYKGPFAYIAENAAGKLWVVDTTTNAVTPTPVTVGAEPIGVAVNPSGTRVYVTNSGGQTVSVINTSTNAIVKVTNPWTNKRDDGIVLSSPSNPNLDNASKPVNPVPWGIAVNSSGTRVYVANRGRSTVSVIDAVTNTYIKDVVVGNTPYGVAVNPVNDKVYVTNYVENTVSVIDASVNVTTVTADPSLPFNKPYGVAVEPSGRYIYVANEGSGTVSVIDTMNDRVDRLVQVGKNPRGIAVNPAGNHEVYVVNHVDQTTAANKNDQPSVSVIDVTNNDHVTTLNDMGNLPQFIAFTPAGTLAYVTTETSGNLSLIDALAVKTAASTVPVVPGATAKLASFGNFIGPQHMVIEFYNANLDNYFITADSSEAAAIEGGSAGPGWTLTGNSFKSGGSASVCRFYGSFSPGPNSHFYTVDSSECQDLKNQQFSASDPRKLTDKSWNFESMDFISTPPTTGGINGTCPTGTTPVYRAYNNGFSRGVDSNHRITSSQAALQEVVARGWIDEGVAMCAPN